jgi:pilus assembly protein CpaE
MRRAMQAGAQDLLPRPLDPGQLAMALRHAHEQKLRRLKMQQKRAEVTVIFGVGGGIGTTTIATNTAVALARSEPGPVLLADFDMHMSNVACFLDMKPTPTYEDVLKELPKMDVEALRQFLPRHASGLHVLSGPQSIEDLDAIKTTDIAQVVELCSQAFKHVIIDGGHGIDERRTELLDRADRILVVTQLNVAAMHSARRTIETLHRLGYDKIHIVANRVGRGTQVTLEDVEVGLGLKPAFSIPNDYPTVIGAIDSGVPIVESKRSGRTAASFKAIAKACEQANGNGNGSKNGRRRGLLFRKN